MNHLAHSDTLTATERDRLSYLESEVTAGFIQAGKALHEIKEKRLYREKGKTWDEYVQLSWDFGREKAASLIEAASVVDNLSAHFADEDMPSESQARQLAKVPDRDQPYVWGEIVEESGQQQSLSGKSSAAPTDLQVRRHIEKRLKYRPGEVVRIVAGQYRGIEGAIVKQNAGVLSIEFDGGVANGILLAEVEPTQAAPKRATYSELVGVLKFALTQRIPKELRQKIEGIIP